MNFEELQNTRESCRVYSDRPVPRNLLTRLAEVARLCPSACNAQPWHFILVDDPAAKARLVEALNDRGLNGCPWGNRVPAFLVICEEKARLKPAVEKQYGSQHFAQMDIGMAAMAICYEAVSLGLGTCMIGTVSQEKIHRALGIPEHIPVRLIITVGYPAALSAPRAKQRKPLEEIVSYNGWSQSGTTETSETPGNADVAAPQA